MVKITTNIFINKPLSQIFPLITDPNYFIKWMPGVKSSQILLLGPQGHGTRILQYLREGEETIEMKGRVSEYESFERWAYVGVSRDYWLKRTLVFHSRSGGTSIDYTEERSIKNLFHRLIPMIAQSKLQKEVQHTAKALKKFLEVMEPIPANS